MAYSYNQGQYVAMGSNSTATSAPWFVGDWYQVSVSINSSASLGPTNVLIMGSNADGLRSSDLGGATSMNNWSIITLIQPGSLNLAGNVGSGLFNITPGFRWIRSAVSPTLQSVASAMTIIFYGVSQ